MEARKYYLNQETQKIELRDLSKEEYQALSDELKKEVKGAYLFSGKIGAWVSRSTNNHYSAIRTAEKLGFTEQEIIGERLSFAEEIERQKEKAEARAERYEGYAYNAEKKAENLQSELNSYHGDIAFMTQPIIKGHSGSEAFGKRRERIFNRYRKGFEEYRKSDYFKSKARTAEETASMSKFKDRSYLINRIKECNKIIKNYESYIVRAEEKQYNGDTEAAERIERYLTEIEYQLDKLAYLENCLEELGGVYNKDNLKVGYEVKIRGSWEKILKLNRTTVEVQPLEERISMFISKRDYSEIQDMRIPKEFKQAEEIQNPFIEGDIFVLYSFGMKPVVIRAYQVLKTTAKGVTVQEVNIDDNRQPIKDGFKVGSKPLRRQITENKYTKKLRICIDDYELKKYDLTA